MKAVVYHQYGSPEVLQLIEVAKPVPRENEVLVKVQATTVTVADVRARAFNVPRSVWLLARLSLGIVQPRKRILGAELAGEVEAVGTAVTRFKPGDQVYAASLPEFGGYAEYKCLPEDGGIALKPANLTYEEAAAVPIGASTALYYLQKANIRPGQQLLVYGASGSVGSYAVQLARHLGAEVTGVCSTANLELVKSLGAARVIDYTREDFARGGAIYDVIFEAVDKSTFTSCMRALKPDGIYLNVTTPLPNPQMLWAWWTSGKKLKLGANIPRNASGLNQLRELSEAGAIRPVIDRRYPLEQIVEAHRYVDTGHKKGNVVISVASRHGQGPGS